MAPLRNTIRKWRLSLYQPPENITSSERLSSRNIFVCSYLLFLEIYTDFHVGSSGNHFRQLLQYRSYHIGKLSQ